MAHEGLTRLHHHHLRPSSCAIRALFCTIVVSTYSAPKAQSQPRFPIFLSLPLSPPASSFLLFHPLPSSFPYNKEQKTMPYSRKAKKEEKSLASVK